MEINRNEAELDRRLFDALYELMQSRTIEELTVGDILKTAQVSRSSFYRKYLDKYDLLIKSYKLLLEETYMLCLKGNGYRDSAKALLDVLASHPKFFHNALITDGTNSLRQYICEISMSVWEEQLRQRGASQVDWRVQAMVRAYVYGSCELLCRWAVSGMKQSAEEILEVFCDCIPPALLPYSD